MRFYYTNQQGHVTEFESARSYAHPEALIFEINTCNINHEATALNFNEEAIAAIEAVLSEIIKANRLLVSDFPVLMTVSATVHPLQSQAPTA